MEEKKTFGLAIVLAVIYLLSVYSYFILSFAMPSADIPGFLLYLPIAIAIVNAVIIRIFNDRIPRQDLLTAAVVIKYSMIPLYILGGLAVAVLFLLIFTPIVFMIFVAPAGIAMLCTIGWVYMVGGGVFSFAYIKKSEEEGVHSRFLCKIVRILQFFYTADVISLMVLAFKEKRFIKVTIVGIAIFIIGSIAALVVLIVKLIA